MSQVSSKLGLGGGFPLTLSDAKATWSRRRWRRHAPRFARCTLLVRLAPTCFHVIR